jgi:hypothetical protein
MDFIAAARVTGVGPDTARKWLHKPEVMSLLRSERKAFRREICAQNEASLKGLRDHAPNSMARIAAIRLLEEMNGDDAGLAPSEGPRFQVVVLNRVEPPRPAIEARTVPAPYVAGVPEPEVEPEPEPIFKPRRW